MPEIKSALSAGEQVAGYQILGMAGAGGMAGSVPSLALMRAVKDQFDPGHRMAPGRFA